jgi:hypothetical protein
MAKCIRCESEAGPRSKVQCDYHAGYHAGASAYAMKLKRKANPEYRDDERKKVGKRMRKRRNHLHKCGLNNRGKPFRSAWALHLSKAKRGSPFSGGCAL